MKALKRDLQSAVKSLKSLTKKIEQISKQLDAAKGAPAAKKPIARTGKKTTAKRKGAKTATDTVLAIIKRRKKGIDTAALQAKTNFDTITIRNIIFRLKKQGKIQAKGRGVYIAV
jgi:hypothetical protein